MRANLLARPLVEPVARGAYDAGVLVERRPVALVLGLECALRQGRPSKRVKLTRYQ